MGSFFRKYVCAFVYLLWIMLPLVAANIQIQFLALTSTHQKIEAYLISFLWIGVGLQGLVTGFSSIFQSAKMADYFNWPYSPAIKELGYAQVAFGVLGLGCWFVQGTWWNATAIGYSIFLLCSAQKHILEIILKKNYSLANIGPTLWAKLFVPAMLLVLLVLRVVIQ